MNKRGDDDSGDIGSALDSCAWDYSPPQPKRRFFLNPLSSFFGDFPWEGRIHIFNKPSAAIHLSDPDDDRLPDD